MLYGVIVVLEGALSQRDEVYMLHGVLVQVRPLRAFGIRVTN